MDKDLIHEIAQDAITNTESKYTPSLEVAQGLIAAVSTLKLLNEIDEYNGDLEKFFNKMAAVAFKQTPTPKQNPSSKAGVN